MAGPRTESRPVLGLVASDVADDVRDRPARAAAARNTAAYEVTFDDVAHGIDFEDDAVKDAKRIPPGEAHVAEMPGEGRFKFSDPTSDGKRGTVVVGGG